MEKITTSNINYSARSGSVVFGVYFPPLNLLFGLTRNRPQSAPACSFLRYLSKKYPEYR